MCQEVDALHATLDKQVLFQMDDIRAFLLHQVRISNFNPQILGQWAGSMVKNFATFKAHQREEIYDLDLDYLSEVGLGLSKISKASGSKIAETRNGPHSRKRATETLTSSPKQALLLSTEERHPERLFIDIWKTGPAVQSEVE